MNINSDRVWLTGYLLGLLIWLATLVVMVVKAEFSILAICGYGVVVVVAYFLLAYAMLRQRRKSREADKKDASTSPR